MEREEEINLFTKSLKFAIDEFYFDSINSFLKFNHEFPESELVDDSLYNIGLCYYHLNQIENSIKYFQIVIDEYPDSTISVLNGGNEYGKTPAKCLFSIINCYLKINDLTKIESLLSDLLKYPDSYIVDDNGNKKSFYELSKNIIENFNKITNKN